MRETLVQPSLLVVLDTRVRQVEALAASEVRPRLGRRSQPANG